MKHLSIVFAATFVWVALLAAPAGADEVVEAYQKANAAIKAGNLEEGATFMKLAFEKGMAADHPQKAILGLNAGILFNKVGKREEAIAVLEPTLDLYKAKNGEDSDKLNPVLDALQEAYVATRNTEKGIPLLDTRIAIATKKFGADSDEVFAARLDRLAAIAVGGEFKKGEREIRKVIRELEDSGRERSVAAGQAWLRLAFIQLANPQPGLSTIEKAQKYTERGEGILEEALPVGHPTLIEHYQTRLRFMGQRADADPRAARAKREIEAKLAKNLEAAKKNEQAAGD